MRAPCGLHANAPTDCNRGPSVTLRLTLRSVYGAHHACILYMYNHLAARAFSVPSRSPQLGFLLQLATSGQVCGSVT